MRKLIIAGFVTAVLLIVAAVLFLGWAIWRHGRDDQTAGRVVDLARICELAKPNACGFGDIADAARQLGYKDPKALADYLLNTGEPLEVIVVHRSDAPCSYAVAAYSPSDWQRLKDRRLADRLPFARWLHYDGLWLRTQQGGKNHDRPETESKIRAIVADA